MLCCVVLCCVVLCCAVLCCVVLSGFENTTTQQHRTRGPKRLQMAPALIGDARATTIAQPFSASCGNYLCVSGIFAEKMVQ